MLHCHCQCHCHCHQHHHCHCHHHRQHQIALTCCHRGKPFRENICFCLVFTELALRQIQSSICDACGSVCMVVCVCVKLDTLETYKLNCNTLETVAFQKQRHYITTIIKTPSPWFQPPFRSIWG